MPPKRTEKRRAVVRNCSRRWRETEAELIEQMAEQLPLPEKVKVTLNKPSILRLSSTMIRAKQLGVDEVGPMVSVLMDAMEGFLITLDDSGVILYVSPKVSDTLGYEPHEMLGMEISEFLYESDFMEFQKNLQPKIKNMTTGISKPVNFVARLKYKTRNSLNKTKQTGYVAMQMKGVIKSGVQPEDGRARLSSLLVLACYPVCMEPNMELSIVEATFVCKFDINFLPIYLPDDLLEYFGYSLKSKIGYEEEMWMTDDHYQNYLEAKDMLTKRGLVHATSYSVTQTGYLYKTYGRSFLVHGPKGEKPFYVCYMAVLRREKVRILGHWPENKSFLACTHTYGVPGETEIQVDDDPTTVMNVQLEELDKELDSLSLKESPEDQSSCADVGTCPSKPRSDLPRLDICCRGSESELPGSSGIPNLVQTSNPGTPDSGSTLAWPSHSDESDTGYSSGEYSPDHALEDMAFTASITNDICSTNLLQTVCEVLDGNSDIEVIKMDLDDVNWNYQVDATQMLTKPLTESVPVSDACGHGERLLTSHTVIHDLRHSEQMVNMDSGESDVNHDHTYGLPEQGILPEDSIDFLDSILKEPPLADTDLLDLVCEGDICMTEDDSLCCGLDAKCDDMPDLMVSHEIENNSGYDQNMLPLSNDDITKTLQSFFETCAIPPSLSTGDKCNQMECPNKELSIDLLEFATDPIYNRSVPLSDVNYCFADNTESSKEVSLRDLLTQTDSHDT